MTDFFQIIDDDNVESMVKERILDWFAKNNRMPERILYYRDGVSDGQYAKVKHNEVNSIRRAFTAIQHLKKVKKRIDAKITAVIVAKRHHTRFYPEEDKDMEGRAKNCQPGTVVDTGVTSPYFMDFFLQSHSGLQGTARPAHYFVVENGMGLTCVQLQNLVSDTDALLGCHRSFFSRILTTL